VKDLPVEIGITGRKLSPANHGEVSPDTQVRMPTVGVLDPADHVEPVGRNAKLIPPDTFAAVADFP
jgi:hypothetical protein